MSDRFGMPIVTPSPKVKSRAGKLRLLDEIANRFTYHAPHGDQAERYGKIRAKAGALALFLADTCPESRELALALTKLDEVVFWANAAIARNEAP